MASLEGGTTLRCSTLRNRERKAGGGFELSGEFRKQGIVTCMNFVPGRNALPLQAQCSATAPSRGPIGRRLEMHVPAAVVTTGRVGEAVAGGHDE